MKHPSPLLAFFCLSLSFPWLAFAKTAPDKERKIVLYAAPKTLGDSSDSKERLASAFRARTGYEVVVLDAKDGRDVATALAAAAEQSGDILVFVQHPTGVPDNFVAASAYNVTTGELIGDASAERKGETPAVDVIGSWFESLRGAINALPRFDAAKFEEHGKSSKKKTIKPTPSSRGENFPMRVKMTGVPKSLQHYFTQAASDSDLKQAIEASSHQYTDLIIHCADDCETGKIELQLPLNDELRNQDVKAMASALLIYRLYTSRLILNQKKNPLRFPIQITLLQPAGADLFVSVSGSANKPSLQGLPNLDSPP